jgi:hypothetical protein
LPAPTAARLETVAQRLGGNTAAERSILASLAFQRALPGGPAEEAAALAQRALAGGLLAERGPDAPAFADAVMALIMAERFSQAERVLAETRAADVRRARRSVSPSRTRFVRCLPGRAVRPSTRRATRAPRRPRRAGAPSRSWRSRPRRRARRPRPAHGGPQNPLRDTPMGRSRTAYDPEGLPLVPGLVEVVTAESSAAGQRHQHLAGHLGEIAVWAWRGNPADPATQTSGVGWILAAEWSPTSGRRS